ncbi:MAG: hypothetical protein AAB556_01270 [Patescibacteria group bacterium]
MKYFVYIVIAVVGASIVAGFFVVDSPAEERLRKFDEQRTGDLRIIQGEIINYWTKKGALPKTLMDLRDDVRGFYLPTDPETEKEYSYQVNGKYEFSLCANFSRASYVMYSKMPKPVPMRPMEFGGYLTEDWNHLAGSNCFSRSIDPELYPVLKK